MLQMVTLPDGRQIPITAPAAKFSRTPIGVRRRAPGIGEHNDEILAELGRDEETRARLKKDRVI